MIKKELLSKLKQMNLDLDQMQESDTAQDNEELMWELGEAIGAINNAIDIMETKKRSNQITKKKTYKTMDDCWDAIKHAKDDTEVELLFEQFPKKFGEWYMEVEYNSFYEKCYVVYNNKINECMTLEIEVE